MGQIGGARGRSSFAAFANDHHDAFSYNNRNKLTKAKRYNNTSPPSTTNEDSSYHRQFVFDKAGNWDWFKLGSDPNTPYVPNALNLYASINDPNDPNTATESFTYDKDQNLTEDGSFEYAYDAENRLIEVVPAEDDPNNLTADDNKLVFTYDYLNRRVRKVVYVWDPNEGDSGDWSATAELDLRFIYHERLLLLELDGLDSNAKVRKYVWGPGSDGRLGGLNSLLATRDVGGTTNYVCFNNGTGSVAQLLDRSDGSVDAKYVYDTRGDTVRNTGTYAADNPLRYQAMYFDHEFDYAGTDCDGLYCAADGTYYSPRVARRLTPLLSHPVSVAHGWTGSLGDIDDGPLIGPPAPLRIVENGSLPPVDIDDDDEDDDGDEEGGEQEDEESPDGGQRCKNGPEEAGSVPDTPGGYCVCTEEPGDCTEDDYKNARRKVHFYYAMKAVCKTINCRCICQAMIQPQGIISDQRDPPPGECPAGHKHCCVKYCGVKRLGNCYCPCPEPIKPGRLH